jgi:hypothetical protein
MSSTIPPTPTVLPTPTTSHVSGLSNDPSLNANDLEIPGLSDTDSLTPLFDAMTVSFLFQSLPFEQKCFQVLTQAIS